MIATSFAVMAIVLQPLLSLNIPAAFAMDPPAPQATCTYDFQSQKMWEITWGYDFAHRNGGTPKFTMQSNGGLTTVDNAPVPSYMNSTWHWLYVTDNGSGNSRHVDYGFADGTKRTADVTFTNVNGCETPEVVWGVTGTLNAENFNTVDDSSYRGVSVGFNAKNFGTVSAVTVDVTRTDGTHALKHGTQDLFNLINSNTSPYQFTAPFVMKSGSYNPATDSFWTTDSAAWNKSTIPVSSTVTVTGSNGPLSVTNTSFSQGAPSWPSYATMAPATTITVAVNSVNMQFDSLQAAINDSTTLPGSTVTLEANSTVTQQVTITKPVTINGGGFTVNAGFDNTAKDNANNSVLSIQADGTVVNDLIVDGHNEANLHGINTWSDSSVIKVALNDVTVQNNTQSGLNVGQYSHVTATNITTAHNGWDGIDVDKTGAVLTVVGVSSHTETGPDIKVDIKGVGIVHDNSNQYSTVDVPYVDQNNVSRVAQLYNLKLAAPTNLTPTDGTLTNNNKFSDTWSAVMGAASYNYEVSRSSANGLLGTIVYSDNSRTTSNYSVLNGIVTRTNGTTPDGTYYWHVQAVDAYGISGPWSVIQQVTIDATAPAQPLGLHYYAVTDAKDYTQSGLAIKRQSIYPKWAEVTKDIHAGPELVDHYNYQSKGGYTTTIDGTDASMNSTIKNWVPPIDTADGFRVQAVDKAGNLSAWSDWMYVDFDSTAPLISIDTSLDGKVLKGPVSVTGFVNDAHPHHYYVQVTKDGTILSANPTNDAANFSGVLATLNGDGKYEVTLAARDAVGGTPTSGNRTGDISVSFTIDNTAPTLVITNYVTNGDGTYTITGTSNDKDSSPVTVKVGSVTLAPVTPANGVWQVVTPALADGAYTITVSSTDAAGNNNPVNTTHTFSTPISQKQQSNGALPAVKRATNIASPVLLATTDNGQAVLGDQAAGKTTVPGVTDQAVKGVNTTRKDTNGNKASMLGFAWYWWIVAALAAALAWWLIAARRRRNQAE